MEKEEKDYTSLQIQWVFVFIGALLAFFLGIFVNAAYDLLTEFYSKWYVLFLSGVITLFLIDAFTFFFDNVEKKDSTDSFRKFLSLYWRYKMKSMRKLIWGGVGK